MYCPGCPKAMDRDDRHSNLRLAFQRGLQIQGTESPEPIIVTAISHVPVSKEGQAQWSCEHGVGAVVHVTHLSSCFLIAWSRMRGCRMSSCRVHFTQSWLPSPLSNLSRYLGLSISLTINSCCTLPRSRVVLCHCGTVGRVDG